MIHPHEIVIRSNFFFKRKKHIHMFLILPLFVFLFWIDTFLHIDIAGGSLYVIPVLIGFQLPKSKTTLFWSLIGLLLIWTGFYYFPREQVIDQGIFLYNRFAATFILLMTSLFFTRSLKQVTKTLYPMLASDQHLSETEQLNSQVQELSFENEQFKNTQEALANVMEDLQAEKEKLDKEIALRSSAEKKATESEERYRKIFENAGIGIALVDPEGFTYMTNNSLSQMLGYSAQEFASMTFMEFTHPDDVIIDARQYEQLVAGEIESYQVEKRYINKDGKIVWGALSVSAIRTGERQYAIGMVNDITDRKEYEKSLINKHKELLSAKALFDEVQQFANIGVWEVDLAENEVFWAEEVYRIHEVPIGTPIDVAKGIHFYHPDYQGVIQKAIEEAISDQRPWDLELKLITAKKRELWVRAAGLPVVEDGKVNKLRGLFMDIDRRKRAEEESQTSQMVMNMAIDIGEIGIWRWNVATENLTWNDEMHNIFDWPKDQFKGVFADFSERLHHEDIDRVTQAIQDAFEGKEKYDVEYRVITRNKELRHVAAKSDIKKDSNGKLVDMIGICTDITMSKETYAREKALREQLRLFIEHTPAAVAMLDHDLKYLAVSNRWCVEYKIEKKHVTGRYYGDMTPDLLKNREWNNIFKESLSGKVLKKEEELLLDTDGNERWLKYEVYPWYDQNGIIGGIGMFTEDITLKKEYENSLIESEARLRELNDSLEQKVAQRTKELEKTNKKYRDLYDNAPEMFVSVSAKDGSVLECNETLLKKTGFSKDEMIGKNVLECYHPDSLEIAKKAFEVFVATGSVKNHELELLKKNGDKIHVLLNVTSVKDKDGNVLESRSSWRDISDVKSANDKINVLNLKLGQKVKDLESLTQELESFSYSVSHDLRAPLRIIDGFSRILLEDYAELLDDEGEETIQSIIKNVSKMSALIDSLLMFSRMSRKLLEKSTINTAYLIDEILNETRLYTDLSAFDIQVADDLPEIYGDRSLLKQVFTNLISNAIKYSRKQRKPVIHIGSEKIQDAWKINIKDNGAGFDMKYYDKLFGVFQRLHLYEEFEGTGVGLALTKKIIDKHGGKISAYAEVNKGATFSVILPVEAKLGTKTLEVAAEKQIG